MIGVGLRSHERMACDTFARRTAVGRGIALELLTVGWNILEGIVAIVSGALAGSIVLVGFGIDSGIESASGGILQSAAWLASCCQFFRWSSCRCWPERNGEWRRNSTAGPYTPILDKLRSAPICP